MNVSQIVWDKLFIRGYSSKTITAYECHITDFMDWTGKSHLKVKQSDIEDYIKFLRKKGYAHSTINLAIAAIKFFFVNIMNRRFSIKSLKKQEKHTGVVDEDTILEAIDSMKNSKHRLLLCLLYGSGLRVGEAVKIKHQDILKDEIIVRQGKGSRDRKAALSKRFLEEYKPLQKRRGYVFKGREGHLTIRSAQAIVKKAFKDIDVHPHMMRASYATHMLERGIHPMIIKRFTGHKDVRTVNIYTNYAKISHEKYPSPIDT